MIRKMKIKFILLSMVSLFVLLLLIVAGMNIISYQSVARSADDVLNLLSRNQGNFPEFEIGRGDRLPPNLPELSACKLYHGAGGICDCVFCYYFFCGKDHQAHSGKL